LPAGGKYSCFQWAGKWPAVCGVSVTHTDSVGLLGEGGGAYFTLWMAWDGSRKIINSNECHIISVRFALFYFSNMISSLQTLASWHRWYFIPRQE
jgi:hypothetical protein